MLRNRPGWERDTFKDETQWMEVGGRYISFVCGRINLESRAGDGRFTASKCPRTRHVHAMSAQTPRECGVT